MLLKRLRLSRAVMLIIPALVSTVLLVAMIVAAASFVERGRASAALVQHTFEVDNLLVELRSSIKDAEIGPRGWFLTGDERYLAAQRFHPALKVLFTTGYTRNAIVHNGVVDPDALLLNQPFTEQQLACAVRAALDG